MKISQFANSLGIIRRAEHTNRPAALLRHVTWQCHKFRRQHLITRRLSHSVLMDDEPGGVIGLVNMLGLYDYNNMSLVQRLLRPGDVFVDVGANVGAYTLVASERPDVTVIALEPNPTAFRKLLRNISVNNRTGVVAVQRAASSHQGMLPMTNRGSDPTNSLGVVEGDQSGMIQVEVDTLDRICTLHSARATVIKIDVEGHEPDVLAGAANSLETAVACIVENGERDAVTQLMHARGLRGPFYFDQGRNQMSRHPQRLAEDAVFIGRSFDTRLPGVTIAAD